VLLIGSRSSVDENRYSMTKAQKLTNIIWNKAIIKGINIAWQHYRVKSADAFMMPIDIFIYLFMQQIVRVVIKAMLRHSAPQTIWYVLSLRF
jgi:hypothetical protein